MDSKKQLNAAQITFRNAAEMLKGARDGIKGKKFLKSSVITFLCSEVVNDTKNSLSTLSGISGNTINRFDELAVGLAEYGAKAAIETLRLEDGEGSDAKAKVSQLFLISYLEDCAYFLEKVLAKLKREKDRQSQLDDIQENTRIAAARTLKELDAKSKGGKKGARIQKEEKSEDEKKTRKAILDKVKKLIRERDERYPNGNYPDSQTNNAIFRSVSKKYLKADGTPIMLEGAISKAYQRAKSKCK